MRSTRLRSRCSSDGSFALVGAGFDFRPGVGEEFDVGANFIGSGGGRGGAYDEAAAEIALGFGDQMAQARRSSAEAILRETPVWSSVGM